jgi:alpha-L-fucosidase
VGRQLIVSTGEDPRTPMNDRARPVSIDPSTVMRLTGTETPEELVAKAAQVVPDHRQSAWMRHRVSGFVHFGVNTFTGDDGIEWGDGHTSPAAFDPADLDCGQWADSFRAAGIRLVILTAKHHDGFCLWPSRYSDYTVAGSPWRGGHGDLVSEFVEAMRQRGIRVGLYLSPADIRSYLDGHYNNGSPRLDTTIPTLAEGDDRSAQVDDGSLPTFRFRCDDFNRYYVNQLYEVLTQYGPIDEIWLDGANPLSAEHAVEVTQTYAFADWYRVMRALQPDAVIFNGPDVRWVGNESGIARETEWSPLPHRGTPDTEFAQLTQGETTDDLGSRTQLAGADYLRWYPAEADVSIRPGWFFHAAENPSVKSAADLLRLYLRSVGRNATLLVNVPPDRRGRFAEPDVASLRSFGGAIAQLTDSDLCEGSTLVALDPPGATRAAAEWLFETRTTRAGTPDLLEVTEQVAKGQRIEAFEVEVSTTARPPTERLAQFVRLGSGTTVGRSRMLTFDPVSLPAGSTVRLRITASRGEPLPLRVHLRTLPKPG